MLIPALKNPYPDELLYSYLWRIADENSLSIPSFISAFAGGRPYRSGKLPVDVREEFPLFYRNMRFHRLGSMKDLYLELTTFQFESMVMTPGHQTAYINNVFRPKDKLNAPVNQLFKKIRICPECLKEDARQFGEPYIHRSHQFSGVCTCHKHGSLLLEYHGKPGHECEFCLEDYEEIQSDVPIQSLQAYTEYAQTLSDARLNTNVYEVKEVLFQRLKSFGYEAKDGYISFAHDFSFWEHSALSSISDLTTFLKVKMISACNFNMTEVIPIMMFLFQDEDDLIEQLQGQGPVLEEYTCPECGEEYCQTPTAHRDGWGCPFCWADLSEQERFEHLVETVGNGHYQPLSEFQSLNEKILMRHNTCGRDIQVKPREFLFDGKRCSCEYTVTLEEAKKAVESHQGFKLIEYQNTNNPVRIYHEKCGREFTCGYHKFLKFPGCRECKPSSMRPDLYEERVKALVGDEYTVVSEFRDQHTKVSIRHNICGCVQEYKPSAFLDGQRCKQCRKVLQHKDLETMLESYSGGKYVITNYEHNVCSVKDTETENLIRISPQKIAQEIRRPTPSPILPVDK